MPSSGRFPRVDRRAARLRFERAARTYAAAARLEQEVGDRMLERLDYVRLAPRRVLDAASGPGREAAMLQSRYPGAQVLRVDFSLAMLRQGHARFFEKKRRVCADIGTLPFPGASFGLVWCNMALHWAQDPLAWLRELSRVLAPEGLLIFSALGPDTLRHLRTAAGAARVHEFLDMHDLGDMLVEAGLGAPVMEMEMLTVAYRKGAALLEDLRATGQTNARDDRPRGMAGKSLFRSLEILEGDATYEVVYGHAWKGAPRRLQDGRDIVQFHSPKRR